MMHPLPPNARAITFTTARGRLSGIEAVPAGEPKGTALLVPGYTGSKEDFVPMLAELTAAGYRVVAYSELGQWRSEGPTRAEEYTLDAFAEGLLEVVTAVGAPVHLLGHSFGGLVTRAAVIKEPGLFRDYTILCSGPSGATVAGPSGPELEAAIARDGAAGAWRFLAPFFAAGQPARVVDFLRTRILETNPANLLGIARLLRTEPDRVAELRATGVPILVAHGEHDAAWPPEIQRDMADRLGARYEVIPEAGHVPNEERPVETARVLVEFWGAR